MTFPSIRLPEFLANKKVVLIALVVAVALIVILAVALTLLRRVSPVTLSVWGLWEEPGVYTSVIADYQRTHPNVTVKYTKQSPLNYRERLSAALSGNSGPDVFLIHNSWVPMLKNNLEPMPTTVYSPTEFKTIFYPTVSSDLISSGKAYGVPLEIDTLALYVNEDILTAGGVAVPTTWDGDQGFFRVAEKLTVRDQSGRIRTAGAAMGTASNVDHWQDIVTLMMLQAGVKLNSDPASTKAQEALGFYTSFVTAGRVWDETLESSTQAFAAGKVGMYFAPSWRFFDLKAINPNLNFKIVSVPQLLGADTVNLASYWVEVVSKKSQNTKVAWDFVKFLSGKETLAKMYTAESKIRQFGEPYSRVDMKDLLVNDPNVGPFIVAAPTAKTWYLASFTSDGDTGINSQIGGYYKKAIDSMLRGAGAKESLDTVAKGVAQVLGNFGVGR